MKITKTASGKKVIKMTKSEWKSIGKKAGWIPTKTTQEHYEVTTFDNDEVGVLLSIHPDGKMWGNEMVQLPNVIVRKMTGSNGYLVYNKNTSEKQTLFDFNDAVELAKQWNDNGIW